MYTFKQQGVTALNFEYVYSQTARSYSNSLLPMQ